jgi:hypothetical protein
MIQVYDGDGVPDRVSVSIQQDDFNTEEISCYVNRGTYAKLAKEFTDPNIGKGPQMPVNAIRLWTSNSQYTAERVWAHHITQDGTLKLSCDKLTLTHQAVLTAKQYAAIKKRMYDKTLESMNPTNP